MKQIQKNFTPASNVGFRSDRLVFCSSASCLIVWKKKRTEKIKFKKYIFVKKLILYRTYYSIYEYQNDYILYKNLSQNPKYFLYLSKYYIRFVVRIY